MTDLVPYRISICGLEEFHAYEDEGVSHVVSILDPGFPEPDGLARLPRHILFRSHYDDVIDPPPDGMVPPAHEDVAGLLSHGAKMEDSASHVLVHCHAGISRSTASAVLLMVRGNPGREDAAFDALKRIRPRCWPNTRILRLGDEILGRKGAIMEAAARFQRWIVDTHPDVARLVALHGRAHEIPEEELKRLQGR